MIWDNSAIFLEQIAPSWRYIPAWIHASHFVGSRVYVVTLRDQMVLLRIFHSDTLGARGFSCTVSGVGHVSERSEVFPSTARDENLWYPWHHSDGRELEPWRLFVV